MSGIWGRRPRRVSPEVPVQILLKITDSDTYTHIGGDSKAHKEKKEL